MIKLAINPKMKVMASGLRIIIPQAHLGLNNMPSYILSFNHTITLRRSLPKFYFTENKKFKCHRGLTTCLKSYS